MPGHTARAKPYPNNIKYLIKVSGYKVVEVADELRIPRSTLYDYISGNRPAPKECLRELASFLGRELGEFQYVPVAGPVHRSSGEPPSASQADGEGQTLAGASDAPASIGALPPQQQEDTPGALESATVSAIHLPISLTPLKLDVPPADYAAWFGMKLAQLFTLITHREGQAHACDALQARLNKEIMMFDDMKPKATSEEYTLSRRQAIIAIAALPLALLTAVQQGHWSTLVKEEFLSRCAASVTACWHLTAGREFTEVERALSNYLPLLMTWAQQPSPQQKSTADLAAQGNILMGLVALHTFQSPKNLHGRVAYCKQAVEYASVSENCTLHVAALTQLGDSLGEMGQQVSMLQTYQAAEHSAEDLSPLVQSKVLSGLAHAYARNGQTQEALRCLGEARMLLPQEMEYIPIFLSGDSGLFQLILREGQTYLELGNHLFDRGHYEQARTTFVQIEQRPPTITIPERIHIEIVNQQALAAMKVGELELFCDYLEKGIYGAKALGSEKRRQEAIDIYWEGRKIWPQEARVKELSDLFISMN